MALGEAAASANPGSRRPRRITFLRPVHLRAVGQRAPLKRMFAGNLSLGGMYVRSPSAFPPGTRVEVFLEARGQVLRFAEAIVVFAMPREEAVAHGRLPGFGLRFTQLPPRSRALVEELLKMVGQARERAAEVIRPRRPAGVAPSASAKNVRRRRLGLGLALGALIGGATAAAAAALPHLAIWLSLWP